MSSTPSSSARPKLKYPPTHVLQGLHPAVAIPRGKDQIFATRVLYSFGLSCVFSRVSAKACACALGQDNRGSDGEAFDCRSERSASPHRTTAKKKQMRTARLAILGFRGINEADIWLGSHSVLVGPNNVGKTTVIETLAFLSGRVKLLRGLNGARFFRRRTGPGEPRHHRRHSLGEESGVSRRDRPLAKYGDRQSRPAAPPALQHPSRARQSDAPSLFSASEPKGIRLFRTGCASPSTSMQTMSVGVVTLSP